MKRRRLFVGILSGLLLAGAAPVSPPRMMESLGRGVVAVRASGVSVYVGWRLLGNGAVIVGAARVNVGCH